jgi:hypothetical protein
LCEWFYADDGRPELPPSRYFRLLVGIDAATLEANAEPAVLSAAPVTAES